MRHVDIILMLLAVALPWSTSVTGILGVVVAFCILLNARVELLLTSLKRPASVLPLALLLLAATGTTWADGVSWPERLTGVGKMAKLLLLPLLLVHYQSSQRAKWIFAAFVASSGVLLVHSFLVSAFPALAITTRLDQPGIPVKNYIDQSQGFVVIAVALAALAFEAAARLKYYLAALLAITSCAFLANLVFINVARSAFLYAPLMFVLLMVRYLSRTKVLLGLVGLGLVCGGLWSASPNLQRKVTAIFTEASAYQPDAPIGEKQPSVALRLEFWRKSLNFFEAAPLLGNGTGSIRSLFERDAVGRAGVSALVVANPHNQTLAAAVQWGALGLIAIWAMWIAHVHLFRGSELVAWIGMLATVQNIASSMFNSHLADFYEGWLYVLFVGIAGGELLRIRQDTAASGGSDAPAPGLCRANRPPAVAEEDPGDEPLNYPRRRKSCERRLEMGGRVRPRSEQAKPMHQ
ncbi:O-antigen ligase family protein [Bradyrhizobium hipponense]|uniref:O-antigen ligase family protein n=1 Tax=Bradyrhizobium hipponense TaxID=2605638 RepID=UPI0016533C77|nr:O-antigen ligase family protein [Bradyrhizobium hipponense]